MKTNYMYILLSVVLALCTYSANALTINEMQIVNMFELTEATVNPVTNHFWNFSTWTSETLTSTKVYDDLEVTAASNKTITIDSSNKSMDGYSFSKRLKLGGTGSSTSRHLHFKVSGPCQITVYGSSSNTSTRTLNIDSGTFGNTIAQLTTTDLSKVTYEYTGTSQTDIYLYSANSGFNIYGILVTSNTSADDYDFPILSDQTSDGY